jgi:hypothetical protein
MLRSLFDCSGIMRARWQRTLKVDGSAMPLYLVYQGRASAGPNPRRPRHVVEVSRHAARAGGFIRASLCVLFQSTRGDGNVKNVDPGLLDEIGRA